MVTEVIPVSQAPTANGSVSVTADLADGFLVGIQALVLDSTGAPTFVPHGRYYGAAFILQSRGANKTAGSSFSGYVTGFQPASVPNVQVFHGQQLSLQIFAGSLGGIGGQSILWLVSISDVRTTGGTYVFYEEAFSGRGEPRSIALGDPGVGLNYTTQAVPAQVRWRVEGFHGQLVTSAVAGNRKPVFKWFDPTPLQYASSIVQATQGATTTTDWSAAVHSQIQTASNLTTENMDFPDEIMTPAGTLVFTTELLDAGDNWGPGQIYLEEWAGPSA